MYKRQQEHTALGFEFGTFTDRFERLEEALQIITGMLRGDRPTLEGRWYAVRDAILPGANVMVVGQDGALSKPDWGDSTRLDIQLDPPDWFELVDDLTYRYTDLRLELADGVVRGAYFFAPAPAPAVRTRITDAMARTFGKATPSADGTVVRFGKPVAACATLGDPMRISLPDCL